MPKNVGGGVGRGGGGGQVGGCEPRIEVILKIKKVVVGPVRGLSSREWGIRSGLGVGWGSGAKVGKRQSVFELIFCLITPKILLSTLR